MIIMLAVLVVAVQQEPLIQLRLARKTPAPGFVLAKSIADSTLYVASRIILEDAGIQQARTAATTDGVVLTIRLTRAATRLNESTKGHTGWRLAIFASGQL